LKKIIIIGILIVALVSLVVYAYIRPEKTSGGPSSGAGAPPGRGPTGTAVGTAKVELGDISQNILATGEIEARAAVEIYPKQTGVLIDVKIEEGARVKAGQVLAIMESDTFEIQVKQALADLEIAKAAFDKNSSLAFVSSESNFKQAKSSVDRLQSVLKQSELDLQLQEKQADIQMKKAEADLRIAKAKLDAAISGAREQELAQAKVRTENAKKNLDRLNELLKAAMISQDQVESAQLQYDIYKAQLSLLEEGTRPEDIEVLKAQVEVAKTSRESAESNKDLIAIKRANIEAAKAQVDSAQAVFDQASVAKDSATWEKDLAQAKASVQKAEASLAMARQKVDDTMIKAPINGIVAKRYLDKGDFASSNRPFASIVDMDVVKVKAKIPARGIANISLRHKAVIKPDDQLGKSYNGIVTLISPVIDRASQTCDIEIEVPNPESKIRPGTFTRIELNVADHKNVTIIPVDAIVKESGENFVYTVEEGKALKKPIIIGLNNGLKAELISGLELGQEFVISGQQALRDGMPVSTGGGREQRPGSGGPEAKGHIEKRGEKPSEKKMEGDREGGRK